MPKTDAKGRHFAGRLLEQADRVLHRRWISGPVGDEQAVGTKLKNLIYRRIRRENRHLDSAIGEISQDVHFRAAIQRHDV